MNDVGILTFQNSINYGAVLQNYALYTVLSDLGFSPEVIDYRSKYIERNEGIRLGPTVGGIARWLLSRGKVRAFRRFRSQIEYSEACDRNSIPQVCSRYDAVVVGSDQVWNTRITGDDPTYFLDFISASEKKKSYAASVGSKVFPPSPLDVRKYIKSFSTVLVREKDTAELLNRMVPGVQTHVVLDPTLLLERNLWASLAREADGNGKECVLVYAISEREKVFRAAQSVSQNAGLPITEIRSCNLRRQPGTTLLRDASPEEFLGMFRTAQTTIVSSFHGVCFSIIFHRDFFFSAPDGRLNTASRIVNLLDALGIRQRSVDDLLGGTVVPIDWETVDGRLAKLRAKSLALLVESLTSDS